MRNLLGDIWLEFSEVLACGVVEKTLKMGILRNSPKWQSVKDPDDKRKRLIRYATLGESYKEAVRAELCGGLEPDEWIVMEKEQAKQDEGLGLRAALVDRIEEVCDEGYRSFLHLYRGVDSKQQRRLARAAGVVTVLTAWYKGNNIPWKKSEPIQQASEWMKRNDEEYPMYLPANPTRLKEKVLAHGMEGKSLTEVIYLPRQGNENRVSHQSEMWWQALAVALATSGRNMTQSAITRKLRLFADIYAREAPSESTIRTKLRETNFLTADRRMDLNNRHLHRQRASMPIADAMFPDDCWEMDGTRVQLAPHLSQDGKLQFLNVVVVRDVYSGAYLGWHFDVHEKGFAYRMALKMAVNLTGRLPYELRHDKFPGHNSPECEYIFGVKDKDNKTIVEGELEKLGVMVTRTSSAVGKARAERGFLTLQQVFESDHLAYWGQGIRATTASAHPTESYRYQVSRELKNGGWDFDAAWMAECGVIAAYNHTPVSIYSRKHQNLKQSPWELYQNAADESTGRAIEVYEIADLFWATKQLGIRNRRITMTVNKKDYYYDLLEADHYEILARYQRPNVKLTVRYEQHDMSKIMLFDDAGNFLAEVVEQESIQLYGPNAQWNKAAEWKEKNKAVDVRRKQELNDYLKHLPAEAAAMMPTKLNKHVSEDAQTAYLLQNAGEWIADKSPKKKAEKAAPAIVGEDFNFEDFARGQY